MNKLSFLIIYIVLYLHTFVSSSWQTYLHRRSLSKVSQLHMSKVSSRPITYIPVPIKNVNRKG